MLHCGTGNLGSHEHATVHCNRATKSVYGSRKHVITHTPWNRVATAKREPQNTVNPEYKITGVHWPFVLLRIAPAMVPPANWKYEWVMWHFQGRKEAPVQATRSCKRTPWLWAVRPDRIHGPGLPVGDWTRIRHVITLAISLPNVSSSHKSIYERKHIEEWERVWGRKPKCKLTESR